LYLKARDRWIGLSPRQRARRRSVANQIAHPVGRVPGPGVPRPLSAFGAQTAR
jgi:hypothetical protein